MRENNRRSNINQSVHEDTANKIYHGTIYCFKTKPLFLDKKGFFKIQANAQLSLYFPSLYFLNIAENIMKRALWEKNKNAFTTN
ncbi:hypothetical protein GCM10023260_14600 [Bartonella acomydis]|uniref:Uncharacterized protein n=1 Tax=Bartonella acomydis TaxID=686234 RepID=A0ABP9MXJ5_9HYPH